MRVTVHEAWARPPKVVFLLDWGSFPHGMAATMRVRLLARAMVQAGAEAHVICLQPVDSPLLTQNRETCGVWHGVTFEYTSGTPVRHPSFVTRRLFEARGWLIGALRLVQLRGHDRVDAVHLYFSVHDALPHRAAFVLLLHLLGVPVVMELNEHPWALKDDSTAVERRVSPTAGMSGVVSISRFLTDWAREEAARHRVRLPIAEVPVLVDLSEQPHVRDLPMGDPLVVFAGSPWYSETVDFILRAMEYVWPRFPACCLVITGARPGDTRAESLAGQLRRNGAVAEGRVRVAGYLTRDELLDLYQEARVLLVPLFDDVRSEARFPTKVAEYLASGRPVVSTCVGEMARLLTDGENVLMCPAGDAEQYGDRICALLADRELSTKVGAAGREYARAYFAYEGYGQLLIDFFEDVSRDARRRHRDSRSGLTEGR